MKLEGLGTRLRMMSFEYINPKAETKLLAMVANSAKFEVFQIVKDFGGNCSPKLSKWGHAFA